MTDIVSGPTVIGPGKGHEWVRTVSAVVAAAALVWGVFWLGDESTKQTDLMRDQTELIRDQTELVERQNTILTCHSEQEGAYDAIMVVVGDDGGNHVGDELLALTERSIECRSR